MSAPLVSIIIPVYNGSNYIKEAIDSSLAQTYSNLEILVVNDGSSDDGATEAIVLSYGEKIRYFSKPNGGVSSALNLGISQMRGEYFSWLSHDDVYEPQKIELQMQQILAHGSANVIALCGGVFIDENSDVIANKRLPSPFFTGFVSRDTALRYLLDKGWFNGCAMLIPRSAFDVCGGFQEDLRFSQDYLMWATILLGGYDLLFNDTSLVLSRIHSTQQTHTSKCLFAHDSAVIAEFIVPQLASSDTSKFLFLFAKRNAVLGCKEAVKICLTQAKNHQTFGLFKKICILFAAAYGTLRPFIRKIYYFLLLRIRTS